MRQLDTITQKFKSDTAVTRELTVKGKKYGLVIFPDLSDTATIRAIVVALEAQSEPAPLDKVKTEVLFECESEKSNNIDDCINGLLSGDVLLAAEDEEGYLIVNARSYSTRGIVEPPTETVMRGPREGFIEDLKTNLSLLERRLKTPDLAIEKMQIGRRTDTAVAVCYLASVASPKVVKKIKERLKKIDIDGIVDSHYLVPYLEEKPLSMFAQVGVCEKPDVLSAKLLEGRVGIFVDGSPIALTLPFILEEDFQSAEDYYLRPSCASLLRLLRYLGLILAVLLPALYVALQNFHYKLIPVRFMITLMSAIKGLPMSPLSETFFVLLLFEIIREASVRMPRAVGMAMSIVGALVLGETAVKAGIISSPAVMVTALSSIALFTVPNQIQTMSILRLVYTVIAGLTGLFGLTLAVLFTLHYICAMNAYNAPYLAPFSPLISSDFKDSIDRAPFPEMENRPESIPNINSRRQAK
ncbi:MAG: spore germination protein [Clostridiales bacterium]|nr:spore germination protein [Clostridiales bacterium]